MIADPEGPSFIVVQLSTAYSDGAFVTNDPEQTYYVHVSSRFAASVQSRC